MNNLDRIINKAIKVKEMADEFQLNEPTTTRKLALLRARKEYARIVR